MILDQTLRLEAKLDTGSADVHVDYVDYIAIGEPTPPQPSRSALSGSADVIILAMPSGYVKYREPINVSVYNTHSGSVVCTIKTDDGTTERIIFKQTLLAGETLLVCRDGGQIL